ncbi:MAG: DNA mismatch repair protein MutL [Crocinitomicaceae bacterium]|nr:DNA mismatch repair protein MutL [Crocinitomicaceae bacterium]|tara:strand:- start:2945 stop:4819 length:1875 start_codon:yes stop_codon:yes gene_type:complete
MGDVIQLLPDNVANQIAAGEVVQRPSSVVKELMENALDAGATKIKLIVKEAGRTLIQVIDNGKGMSPTDARLSLERHATSKIRNAEDLFQIKTMGFRGEALASIVAVAQCELKTKRAEDELGTLIQVEGSETKKQEPCTCENGSSVSVKNLFFNLPARRKFLKSNAVEKRHIIDQFERISIIYPQIKFLFYLDDIKLFHLEPGTLRQRIVGVFGKNYNDRLVPINEETSLVKLAGFIGKPEFAKKKRDGQFLFVNGRFIKSNYLHHGILAAYDELVQTGYHPSYFIHLECDPESIDVNIHPTKTEVKFEDEKSIYAIIRSSVRKALGEHNIAPSLDFNRETAFDEMPKNRDIVAPSISVDPSFNPFEKESGSSLGKLSGAPGKPNKTEIANWGSMIQKDPLLNQQQMNFSSIDKEFVQQENHLESSTLNTDSTEIDPHQNRVFQIHGKYILSPIKSGLMVIDQRRAHERVLYERNLKALALNQGKSQKSLFPVTLEFNASDGAMLQDLSPELHLLGFEFEEFGKNSFIVRGLPAEAAQENCKELFDELLATYKENEQQLELKSHVNIAFSLAQKESKSMNRVLSNVECSALIDELFACENPQTTVGGKPIISTLSLDELNNKFN